VNRCLRLPTLRPSHAILAAAAVLLCAGAPAHAREARKPHPQPAVSAADVAQRIHKRINEERRKQKLPALAWDAALARRTVEGWMASSGHRANILTPQWHRQGIGVEIRSDNRVLITQNFC
jgi:uncharacterized protein YkwD